MSLISSSTTESAMAISSCVSARNWRDAPPSRYFHVRQVSLAYIVEDSGVHFRLARRHESLMPQLKKADNSADWKRQAK
jgi:hypothetical protein